MRSNSAKFSEPSKPMTAEESVQYIENINMAYKDISDQAKEQDNKLKHMDPQRAEQMERLGMGFRSTTSSSKTGISHSALGDMKTIEEANPSSKNSSDRFESFSSSTRDQKDLDRKLMLLELTSESGFGRKNNRDDEWESLDFVKSTPKQPQVIDSVPTLDWDNKSSRSSKKVPSSESYSSNTDEAQKKFGSAKAISSAQFFGNDSASDFEERSRLNKFQGASSLSSDEYFGRNTTTASSSSGYSSLGGTNLYDIKEGVRDGVTKVAGRLSNLASDVMSSIQDKYGS